jgi:hypothetical protein
MPHRGELVGGATVWNDLNFPIIPRATGSNITAYVAIDAGGVLTYPQWQVNDYNVCDSNELVHGWKEGSTISWHIHVLTNGQEGTEKYLKWELIWAIADPSEPLAEMTTITTNDIAIPANTATKTHLILTLGTVALANYRIGAHIWPRLKRVTAAGAAPAADPWCSMLQAHIECDTLGSSQVTAK